LKDEFYFVILKETLEDLDKNNDGVVSADGE
jgi:hypothetical protein